MQPSNGNSNNGFTGCPPDKLNGQLKNHLDSIFSGFQKLISGSEDDDEPKKLPFVIEKTIHNILFIKTHMQRQDEFDAVRQKIPFIFKPTFILTVPLKHLTIVPTKCELSSFVV